MPRKNGTRRNIRTIERIVKLIDESDEGELSTLQIHDGFLEKWIMVLPQKHAWVTSLLNVENLSKQVVW